MMPFAFHDTKTLTLHYRYLKAHETQYGRGRNHPTRITIYPPKDGRNVMKNAWRLLLLAANLIGSSVVAEDDLVDAKVDDLAEMYEEEPPYFPCRRDPTWQRTVNYEHCRALSEWNPYGTWWALDHEMVEERLDGREQELATCLHLAFENAKDMYHWAQ